MPALPTGRCEGWQWRSWEDFAKLQPLFKPSRTLLSTPSFRAPVGIRSARIQRHMRGSVLFFIGYPGSGKGTQVRQRQAPFGTAVIGPIASVDSTRHGEA